MIKQVIADNPNLSVSALSRFLNVKESIVRDVRQVCELGSLWRHGGVGIPFLTVGVSGGGVNYKIRCKDRTIASCSSLNSAMENLDRLIFCLENNNGKLPRTLNEVVFGELEFNL